MPAPQVHWLVVGVPELEVDRLERHAAAGRIVQHVARVLLVQDVAVPGRHVDASQNATAPRRTDAFVVCQIGAVDAQ